MPGRTAIFIDGAYLDHVLKDEFQHVRIDFAKLSARMAGDAQVLRTYYYHCPPYQSTPPTEDERQRYSERRRFYAALDRLPRYMVRLGRLARRSAPGEAPRFEQKRVDILLGVDLVLLAAKGQIQEAIILAGDSDFIPALEVARQEGVLVRLFHGASRHNELWEEADERVRITQDFIDSVLR